MYEGKYIQPCTPELALEVGLNLRWIASLSNPYLHNYADMRNEQHIKLLKLLKFNFLNYKVYNGVPLIEFYKLCVQ